jgi:cell division septation protein DedD
LGYLLGRSQYDTQLLAAASTLPGRPDTNITKSPAVAGHSSAEAPPAEPPSDWDFYHSGEPEKPAETLPVQPKPISSPAKASLKPAVKPIAKPSSKSNDNLEIPAAAKPVVPSSGKPAAAAKSLNSPLIPHGASVLQVAALVRQADALALAQALQKKKFPAFVLDPPTGSNDHFFRVQVGPYADGPSANAARQKLESQGFKSIIKR